MFQKNDGIHVGRHEIEGEMIIHPVHYYITIQIIYPKVWLIIFGIIMYGFAWFKDKKLDVFNPNNIHLPVLKMNVVAIIKYNLVIEWRRAIQKRINGP